jgi:polyisoprenoid-binding protein YceI
MKTGDDDRDASLEGPDWFDVKRFPKWTFASTKISPVTANAFTIEGLLTIHGVARPERLDATVSGAPAHPVYHATGAIDRHAFGMTVTRLDPVIGNPVNVTLDVVLR